MRIIVNADDFGRSSTRNYAIDIVMKNGCCTQTSLMVNMPNTEDAVKLAKSGKYTNRVCMHLNLTLGEPITNEIKNTPFCGQDGQFIGGLNPLQVLKSCMKISIIRSLKKEVEAQIKKYLEFGMDMKHIDSHNWIHLYLPVWIVLLPLLKKYGFKSVRPMREGLKHEDSKYMKLYYRIMDVFINTSGYVKVGYSSNLEEFLNNDISNFSENDFVEIFTHPDYVNGAIIDASWSYKGEEAKSMEYVKDRLTKFTQEKYTYRDCC